MMFDPCTDGRPEWWEIDIDHHLADGLRLLGGGRHPGSKYFHDSSLFGNDGLLTNMDPPTDWVWVPELGRWATEYDGVTAQYINLGLAAPLLTPPFTILSWVKAVWSNQRSILGPSNVSGVTFRLESSGILYLIKENVVLVGQSTGTVANGVRQHVAVSYSAAGEWQFWINGQSSGSGTNLVTFTYADEWIGWGAVSQKFKGLIGDLCIYNRILSAAEIAQEADPSNVMLSGLIPEPRRRIFPAAAAPPAGAIMNQMQGANLGADLFDGTILAA